MASIFDNNKNAELFAIISNNPTTSYKEVDTYLASNPGWKRGYYGWRKKQGLPYATKNALIWELVNMVHDPDEGSGFEE